MKITLDEKKKKKDCSSVTHTTGDIGYNIKQFNKRMGTDFNNPSTEEAKANKAAEQACAKAGTFAAASPDGGSSVSAGGEAGGGEACGESLALQEAKRYVRRYYIRPQNIFCSNKTDVLNALIEFADQDCSIYTLNNLGDIKDVTKLTNKDIIYYYDDGILYDKNKMKVMDYDLYIKHEENRPKIEIDKVSDATLAKVYDDRLTGNMTDESLIEGFEDHGYLTSNGYKILNGNASAVEYPFIVANLVDDQLWFYGAYNDENKAKAAADTLDCGTIIYAKDTKFVENLNTQDAYDEDEFNLTFENINAYGEKLVEGKEKDGICCICGEEIDGYGNNAEPYKSGRCCDACNMHYVIPARLEQMSQEEEK